MKYRIHIWQGATNYIIIYLRHREVVFWPWLIRVIETSTVACIKNAIYTKLRTLQISPRAVTVMPSITRVLV